MIARYPGQTRLINVDKINRNRRDLGISLKAVGEPSSFLASPGAWKPGLIVASIVVDPVADRRFAITTVFISLAWFHHRATSDYWTLMYSNRRVKMTSLIFASRNGRKSVSSLFGIIRSRPTDFFSLKTSFCLWIRYARVTKRRRFFHWPGSSYSRVRGRSEQTVSDRYYIALPVHRAPCYPRVLWLRLR